MEKSRCRHRALLFGFLWILFAAVSATGSTLVVNSTGDDGTGTCTASKCTLRDAILNAVASDTITFSLPANSTITLTNGELFIDKHVIINGPGTNLLTVRRSTASGTPQFRIFEFASPTFITNLTISNGNASGNGGAIYNHTSGTSRITNCTISGNSAGGNNSIGGGILSDSGTLTITNSTISGNTAGFDGGGIYNRARLNISNSTISGNMAAADGGGIYNDVSQSELNITNSTISGNTGVADGGGIYSTSDSGSVTIINATISGNSTNGDGGGIRNIKSNAVGSKNTIIALNTAAFGPDVNGPLTSQGFNLIGNNKDATITSTSGDQIGTPGSPINPMLGPLQDNGAPTFTRALLPGSRAIDQGSATVDPGSQPVTTDQRGFTRPVDTPTIANAGGGDGSDIGAYEVQPDQLTGCSEINLIVNNSTDAGAGSLRSIIANACGGSTITFAANVRGAINLTSGELLINKNLTINGPGANMLSVQRSSAAGTSSFRIFNIAANANVTISGLTIANGNVSSGGGISNAGTLTLINATLSGNMATNGGGIFNNGGTLTITGDTISGNTVSNTLVAGSGGGIFNSGGNVDITSSTISGNSAIGPGGNSDSGGGIITNVGTVTITSSTISGNSGDLGGGIRNVNGGSVTATNTIIALNSSASGPDFNGPLQNGGYVLLGDPSGTVISPDSSDQIGVTPAQLNLGPLQDNGGPTQTRALLSGSVAIDKGKSFDATTDQRGFTRPVGSAKVSGGDGSDIGAFEVQATTLANVSTRLPVLTGDNALIGGFIVTGTQPKKVIIRALGPSVPVPGALADPVLELYSGSTLLESNDNWVDSPNKQAIIDSTIPPSNNLESAIVRTLPSNGSSYTAIVRGINNGTGIGVVEAYDLDRTVDSKLANISTRGLVQTGDNVLIAGTIILGQIQQKVIIRAIGPSLTVPGKLGDPTLELHDGNGATLESNDNWMDSPNKQAIIDSTIPPSDPNESAIVRTLPANGASYTAIVRGVNGTTGIAVVEVYALQ